MELNNKKSVMDNLNKYTYSNNENDYIEVTEWTSGEGWDIDINDKKHISLQRDELEAINYLTKVLEYKDEATQ